MSEFKKLSRYIVEQNLANIGQIVFEVTSACNLRCEYCGNGPLYGNTGDKHYVSRQLAYVDAVTLLDYFAGLWKTSPIDSPGQKVFISFYGGEPLLSFPLIEKIVNYVENLGELNRRFVFSMTSNCLLLHKYMDFIASRKFHLLISLDGDEVGDSYRVDVMGKPSFERVIKNIESLRTTYPNYFAEFVNFNAVLHDRNSYRGITAYIREKFGKIPSISSISDSNINPDAEDKFREMYVSIMDSVKGVNDLDDEQFFDLPLVRDIIRDIFITSGNVFQNYNDLLLRREDEHFQTGTCTPFSKKIFLTAESNIQVCERIPPDFIVGNVTKAKVNLDLEQIVCTYNSYYAQLERQCSICGRRRVCNQCLFQLSGFPEITNCGGFVTESQYARLRGKMRSLLASHPDVYEKIIDTVVLS